MKKKRQTQKTYVTSSGTSSSQHNYQLQFGSSNSQISRQDKQSMYQNLRMKNAKFKEHLLFELLRKIVLRRKMFSFQVIKQFYLFPDESISENISFDTYDLLFLTDEPMHTIIKIYQTKQLQLMIWAFINLKAVRLRKKLQKFSADVANIQEKVKIRHKQHFFSQIKSFSIKIKPKLEIKRVDVSPPQKNKIYSNQISQKIVHKIQREERKPQIIRIKSASPKITKVQLSPLRSRVIYPNEEDLNRRKSRESSYKKGEVRVLSKSPRRQVISSYSPMRTTDRSSLCQCSFHCGGNSSHYGGKTCIHIHGNCTINCSPQHVNMCSHEKFQSHLNHSHHSNCSCHHSQSNQRSSIHNRQEVKEEYNMGQRIQYLSHLEEQYKRRNSANRN